MDPRLRCPPASIWGNFVMEKRIQKLTQQSLLISSSFASPQLFRSSFNQYSQTMPSAEDGTTTPSAITRSLNAMDLFIRHTFTFNNIPNLKRENFSTGKGPKEKKISSSKLDIATNLSLASFQLWPIFNQVPKEFQPFMRLPAEIRRQISAADGSRHGQGLRRYGLLRL